MMWGASRQWSWPWDWQWCIAAGLVLTLRLWLVARYGILDWPDSGGYIDVAQQILKVPGPIEFLSGNVKLAGFRILGYPLLLAGAMALFGPAWQWAVVCFQIVLLLCMLWWLYRLGVAMQLGRGFSAFAAGVFACSHLAIYESSILTDAVTTHLTVIAIAALLVPLLEGRRVGVVRALVAGLLLTFAFLIREATLYLVPVVLLALAGMSVFRGISAKDIAKVAVAVALPVVLVWQGYLAWTEARTGYRALATVGQSVYLLHPLNIERKGRFILREPRLREAADVMPASYPYGQAVEMNKYLAEKYRLNEWQRAELSRAAYWGAWEAAPGPMLRQAVKELRPKYAVQLADVSSSFVDLNITAEMVNHSLRSKGSAWVKMLRAPFRIFSALIFIACVVGVPAFILLPRLRRMLPAAPDALVACWLLFVALTGMYAMIHMEFRHFLPVQAFAVLSGLAILRHIGLLGWRRFRPLQKSAA